MLRVTVKGLLARKLRLTLTALAIVLGVTFVTGTLVLGDTLNRTFNSLVGTAYQHVSFEIRGKAAFKENTTAAVGGTVDRQPVPASIVPKVARVPGVVYVRGSVEGYAQFMTRDGNAIGNGGGSTLGFSFDPNRQLSPYHLVAGRAPLGPADVVIDKATATKYGFRVGDRVLINLLRPATAVHGDGIATFGSDKQPRRGDARRVLAAVRHRHCSGRAAGTTRSACSPRQAPTWSSCSVRSPGSSHHVYRW